MSFNTVNKDILFNILHFLPLNEVSKMLLIDIKLHALMVDYFVRQGNFSHVENLPKAAEKIVFSNLSNKELQSCFTYMQSKAEDYILQIKTMAVGLKQNLIERRARILHTEKLVKSHKKIIKEIGKLNNQRNLLSMSDENQRLEVMQIESHLKELLQIFRCQKDEMLELAEKEVRLEANLKQDKSRFEYLSSRCEELQEKIELVKKKHLLKKK